MPWRHCGRVILTWRCSGFRRFLEANPSHDYADNAAYWIGECHYDQRQFRAAERAFRDVVERYPHGNKVPDAMLKLGFTLQWLGDEPGGRAVLESLARAFPKHEAARMASERLAHPEPPPRAGVSRRGHWAPSCRCPPRRAGAGDGEGPAPLACDRAWSLFQWRPPPVRTCRTATAAPPAKMSVGPSDRRRVTIRGRLAFTESTATIRTRLFLLRTAGERRCQRRPPPYSPQRGHVVGHLADIFSRSLALAEGVGPQSRNRQSALDLPWPARSPPRHHGRRTAALAAGCRPRSSRVALHRLRPPPAPRPPPVPRQTRVATARSSASSDSSTSKA